MITSQLTNAKLLLIIIACHSSLSYIILHICRIIFRTIASFLAIERKEVAAQHGTDALQQYRVDTFTLEDVIHVRPITVQLLGKPGHAAPLTAQLSFYLFSDVY